MHVCLMFLRSLGCDVVVSQKQTEQDKDVMMFDFSFEQVHNCREGNDASLQPLLSRCRGWA